MVSYDSISKYWKQYPDGGIGYSEPDGGLMISNLENGKTYKAPANETDELFEDRLERSKKARRNLFFEEWEEYISDIPIDADV